MGAPSSDSAGVRQVYRALKTAGCSVDSVYDGEEEIKVANENEAVEAVMAVDEAYLYVTTPAGNDYAWVRFVLGNDPEEVVNDYTVSLDFVLEPLFDSWGV